jgi:hypothetical protein
VESQLAPDERKPYFDEDAFQQLLAAAYVIQQQNDLENAVPRRDSSLRRPEPKPEPEETLAIIADTQEMLRSLPYDRTAAANLVAERLLKITRANGIAIAVERDGQLEYCAALGTSAGMAGTSITIPAGASASDAAPETNEAQRADSTPIADLNQNAIALPLRHQGKVSGILEVRFDHADAIQENELTACQLMAGLMTEALARATDLEWKRALATERATMLEALGRIMPQLERLAGEPAPDASAASPSNRQALEAPPFDLSDTLRALNAGVAAELPENHATQSDNCPTCGHTFGGFERFCGKCGTARLASEVIDHDVSSSTEKLEQIPPEAVDSANSFQSGVSSEIPGMSDIAFPADNAPVSATAAETNILSTEDAPPALPPLTGDLDSPAETETASSTNIVSVPAAKDLASPWNSSLRTRQWLESLKQDSEARAWLGRQRANLYVAVAVTLLVVAIMGWGMRWPDPLQAQSKNPPSSLTPFEEFLVKLDLAEPAPVASSSGNPNTQVWVDLHHALYYCPGSDLYGKTPNGKFTTQRDAQLDQFEPAERKNCN